MTPVMATIWLSSPFLGGACFDKKVERSRACQACFRPLIDIFVEELQYFCFFTF